MTTPIKRPQEIPVLLPFRATDGMPPDEDWEADEPNGDFSEPDVFIPDEEAFPEPGDFWIDDDDWDCAA